MIVAPRRDIIIPTDWQLPWLETAGKQQRSFGGKRKRKSDGKRLRNTAANTGCCCGKICPRPATCGTVATYFPTYLKLVNSGMTGSRFQCYTNGSVSGNFFCWASTNSSLLNSAGGFYLPQVGTAGLITGSSPATYGASYVCTFDASHYSPDYNYLEPLVSSSCGLTPTLLTGTGFYISLNTFVTYTPSTGKVTYTPKTCVNANAVATTSIVGGVSRPEVDIPGQTTFTGPALWTGTPTTVSVTIGPTTSGQNLDPTADTCAWAGGIGVFCFETQGLFYGGTMTFTPCQLL